MPDSMYDKLGDLLKQTLEEGHVKFVKEEELNNIKASSFHTDNSIGHENLYEQRLKKNLDNSKKKQRPKATYFIGKIITPQIQEALKLFGLTEKSSKEELKAVYKQKLKTFHPDRYQNNEIVKKIAEEKTKQLIENYTILENFFS